MRQNSNNLTWIFFLRSALNHMFFNMNNNEVTSPFIHNRPNRSFINTDYQRSLYFLFK